VCVVIGKGNTSASNLESNPSSGEEVEQVMLSITNAWRHASEDFVRANEQSDNKVTVSDSTLCTDTAYCSKR
jgi:hypothetical protein